jgi:hypothetical protein
MTAFSTEVLNLSLGLIKYCTMKGYGRMELQLHTFLTSAEDGEQLASYSGHFIIIPG